MTDAVARCEPLYSASARMMCLQDSPSWRNGTWPPNRSRPWQELETVLVRADPNRLAEAALTWSKAVRGPDPSPGVVLQGPRLRAVVQLLDELRQRLCPGRPAMAVAAAAGELSEVVHQLADSLRAPITGRRTTPLPGSGVTMLPLALPQYDVLARAAYTAASVIPAPEELRSSGDFSVKHDVAVAARQVLALLSGRPETVWSERRPGIEPERHLVAYYLWDTPAGRPVGFDEAAAQLRRVLRDTRAPWVPVPADPLPDSGPASWARVSGATAMVSAELLDELAIRLTPGLRTGLVGFGAYSWFEFLGELTSSLTSG